MAQEWVTTSTILARLRDAADQSMWTSFQQRFERPLAAFARRMGLSDADAADATQECLLAFFASYREGKYERQRGRLSSWLFAIAYNQFANVRRRLLRERAQLGPHGAGETPLEQVPAEAEASHIWDRDWEEARLETALRQARREMATRTFEAFELVVRQGRSPDDVAAALGMSRDAVYVAKHRVLKRVRELAADYDDAEPPET